PAHRNREVALAHDVDRRADVARREAVDDGKWSRDRLWPDARRRGVAVIAGHGEAVAERACEAADRLGIEVLRGLCGGAVILFSISHELTIRRWKRRATVLARSGSRGVLVPPPLCATAITLRSRGSSFRCRWDLDGAPRAGEE